MRRFRSESVRWLASAALRVRGYPAGFLFAGVMGLLVALASAVALVLVVVLG
ncbi:MAG: hypothetical protein IT452_22780 [Planctomycetia bacterium]|nr:hypothetical protein [Planctomycetia bacterium]